MARAGLQALASARDCEETMKHPMQPIDVDERGVARFRSNKIVEWLFDSGRLDLNAISTMSFDDADRMQIAQLLGYSVAGFGDLPYADPAIVAAADDVVGQLLNADR